jgi:hypothetical protein
VNDTEFPYTREYAVPSHAPAQTGRGRGKSGRGTRAAVKSTPSATPKRPSLNMEISSQQKKQKCTKSRAELMDEMCERTGLDPDALLKRFISNAPNLDHSAK